MVPHPLPHSLNRNHGESVGPTAVLRATVAQSINTLGEGPGFSLHLL